MKFINLKNKNMPAVNDYIDVEMDVSVDDFLNSCDSSDIEEIIEALVEDGWIKKINIIDGKNNSILENEFNNIINKISDNRLLLTNEEEEILRKISNRF
jgi:hypothetical protein